MATDTAKLVDELGKMTVLELVELKNALEETWGVTAAAPVAVAAAGGGDGAAAVEEKTAFDVVLQAAGDKKIQVIKVVRAATGLGLKEAKDLVDGAPGPVKAALAPDEPEQLKAEHEDDRASAELKERAEPHGSPTSPLLPGRAWVARDWPPGRQSGPPVAARRSRTDAQGTRAGSLASFATLLTGQLHRPARVAVEQACPLFFPVPPRALASTCPSLHQRPP